LLRTSAVFCRSGLADHLDVRLLAEDLPDRVSVQGVVVHRQHPDGVGVQATVKRS
jgi:hypothetical protein